MGIELKLFGIGLLYLLTIGAGFWLSYSGKTLNTLVSAIHKLLAVASVVFTVVVFWGVRGSIEVTAAVLALMIVWALAVIALFVSGAMLSGGNRSNALLLAIHRIAPVVIVVAIGAGVYLLI